MLGPDGFKMEFYGSWGSIKFNLVSALSHFHTQGKSEKASMFASLL